MLDGEFLIFFATKPAMKMSHGEHFFSSFLLRAPWRRSSVGRLVAKGEGKAEAGGRQCSVSRVAGARSASATEAVSPCKRSVMGARDYVPRAGRWDSSGPTPYVGSALMREGVPLWRLHPPREGREEQLQEGEEKA